MNRTPMPAELVKEGCYLTYPHSNGFADNGRSIVLGRMEGRVTSLWKIPPDPGNGIRICEFEMPGEPEQPLWFDVAQNANRMAVVQDNGIWIYDPEKPGRGECFHRVGTPNRLYPIPSITSDGRQVLFGVHFPDHHAALSVDVETGKSRILFEKPWLMGHFHFSPHDENWIGFCHEGPCGQTGDRLWGRHATHAPHGLCLLDQHWGDPDRELSIGHERWCFHDSKAAVVAYGASRGEMRGIYETGTDGKSRLISRGDRDWHLNVSCDGRWIVADTSGPHDLPGKAWENAGDISDIILIDSVDGSRRWLARSRLRSKHPFHPHPVFSPDGRFIYYNEAASDDHGDRVMRVANSGLVGSGFQP